MSEPEVCYIVLAIPSLDECSGVASNYLLILLYTRQVHKPRRSSYHMR